ncbi:MAG: GNAT family N-acetyltransferase [Betaproteobacteria bacterium]
MPEHYLRRLLVPSAVALVGASEKPASPGRIVFENLLRGNFMGELHAVNPNHRRVLGHPSFKSVTAIGKPVDLVLVVVPCVAVPGVLENAAEAGAAAAVILSAPPADDVDARLWHRDLLESARRHRIRLLGPHSFGIMRTNIGLNATLGTAIARPGRLALIAQSGAMCTAMLDFAGSAGMGFSTVAALGGGVDIGFGELLDAVLLDPDTEGILLYVETVRDARHFMSALRAAARAKPVVVLKAGRSSEIVLPRRDGIALPLPDEVFDAAMQRSGTVRVMTYSQLFAAARILAMGKFAHGERLAIITNGHGPGTLAADIAADRGVALAQLSRATEERLGAVVPANLARRNPVNVRGDATAQRLAAAVEIALGDEGVDAVLALHVQRPVTAAADAARAVAEVARRFAKPVLGAWLGALDRQEVQDALEAGGVANFYTPEHAVEAFSFMAAYRHNQQWLLEVAPPQPEPELADLAAVQRLRKRVAAGTRTVLNHREGAELLLAFGLPLPRRETAGTLEEALSAARRIGYPVQLVEPTLGRETARGLRSGAMLSRAYARWRETTPARRYRSSVLVQKETVIADSVDVAVAVHTDAVFGPVITLGRSAAAGFADCNRLVLLPPLNRRLIVGAITGKRGLGPLGGNPDAPAPPEPLVRLLLQVSSLVCAVPWLQSLVLDPVRAGTAGAVIEGVHAVVDAKRQPSGNSYGHMAIHPYPVELVSDIVLADGTALHVRPIMPEDAELERAFVAGLSEETRYLRFFYQLHELTPSMLARFTQVDYDRELALVAIRAMDGKPAFVSVARYVCNADLESAEFAVVVADAWQRRGAGRVLMQQLIAAARTRGVGRLEGTVLRSNHKMLRFTESLGFVIRDDTEEPDQLIAVLALK